MAGQTQITEDAADSRTGQIEAAIRQARLVVGAMALGALTFAAIVLGLSASRGPLMGANQSLPVFLGAISVLVMVLNLVIGLVIVRRVDAKARRGEVVVTSQVSGAVLTFAALIQAPTLLAAVAALLGGPPYLLIALVGSAILLAQWIRLPDRMRDMAGGSSWATWR
ncbi:MAG: hypothetical protein IT430_11620 [Phycisphaerales bacterium]|nr:hypothetical protein [Phycisphaerales bacterium]